MKKLYRSLILILPLAALVFFYAPTPDSTRNPEPLKSAVSQPTPKADLAPPPPKPMAAVSMPPPPTGSLWSFNPETAGEAAGLSKPIAAASRGNNILPSGRRHRIESFPNLRQLREGGKLQVNLPDGRVFQGTVNWSRRDEGYENTHQVSIGFAGDKGGVVVIHDGTTDRIQGRLLVEEDQLAWTLQQEKDGFLWLVEHLREDLICKMPPVAEGHRTNPLPEDPSVTGSGTTPPTLNSRPSASAVLYLDFDGAPTQTYADWPTSNPGGVLIVAAHSGLSADQMTAVWRRVAEDFIQFNINVTTDLNRYRRAAVGDRMRILINRGYGSAGIALMQSFRTNEESGYAFSSTVPSWLSVNSFVPLDSAGDRLPPSAMTVGHLSSLASNTSHEFGHTLALWHDGDDGTQPDDDDGGNYYDGHGAEPFDWGSIMGSPYRASGGALGILQWAKNDYPGANNSQNDLAILAGTINGFGYAPDESVGYIDARALTGTGSHQVGAEGVIANQEDLDWWLFTVPFAGITTIEMAPADTSVSLPNLDCGFRIEDMLGNTVAGGFQPENNLEAKAELNLAPGSYHVVAYGTGNKTFRTGGYNDYGSTGRYLVSVDLPPDVEDPVPLISSPAAGVLTSPSLEFHGTVTDNDRISALGIFLRRNSDNAYWNGSYWQIGFWQLARDHNASAGTWRCTANLPQVGGSGPGSLNAGSYDFIVIAEDPAGHSKQVDTRVTVDSGGPVVTIGSPSVTLSSGGYSFSGTSQDTNGVQAVNCFIRRDSDGQYWNGSAWGAPAINLPTSHVATSSSALHSWTCNSPGLPQPGGGLSEGTYTFIAIAVDPIGNHTQTDSVVLIDDNLPPQLAVTTPSHNAFVSGLPNIGGTAADMSGIKDNKVTFTLYQVNTGKFWSGSNWVDDIAPLQGTVAGSTWSFTAKLGGPILPTGALLPAGQYLISASARDNAGTPSQATGGVNQTSFRVDLDPPTVSIDLPLNGSTISALPSISGTASDPNGLASVRLYLLRRSDGNFWDGSSWGGGASAILPTQVSGGTWNSLSSANLPASGSNPSTNLTNDSYNIIVFAVDAAGNQTRTDSSVAVQLVYTWTGATLRDSNPNNNSHSWGTPENWLPNGTPGFGDIVVIDNGDRVDSTISRTVSGLRLSRGMLNFTNGPGTMGTLRVMDESTWTGGSFYGAWENSAGALLTISGADGKELRDGSVFDNLGTVVWEGSAPVSAEGNGFVANAVINNRSGGRFRLLGGGDVFSRNSGRSGVPVFNNQSNAVLEAVDGAPRINTFHLNNAGVIEFTGGSVLTLNTVTNFTDAAPVAGTGILVQAGGSMTVQGDLNAAGPQVVFRGGDIVGHSDGTAAFKMGSGGRIRLYGGRFFNTFAIPSGHRIEIEDAPEGLLGREFRDGFVMNNAGTVNWRGTSPIASEGNGYVANPVFNNKSGGVFAAAGGNVLFSRNSGRAGTPVFNNESGAVFRKVSALPAVPVLTIDTAIFNNQGALEVDEGVLAFNTTVNHQSATPLTGPGTYEFRGGRLGITGPFSTTGTAAYMLGGQVVSEANSASLVASGSARIHLQGGSYLQKFTIPEGNRVEIDDPATGAVPRVFRDGMVLDNSGMVTWAGGSSIVAQGDGYDPNPVFNNKPGSVFIAAADGTLFSRASGRSGTPQFNNEAGATFRKSSGSGELIFDTFALSNAGAMVCESGLMAFNTRVDHSSTVPLAGPGFYEFRSGRLGIIGTFASATECYLKGGDIVSEGNTAVLNASGSARIHLQGGIYYHRFTLPSGQRLELDDPSGGPVARQFRDGFVLDNSGTVTWAGGSPIQAQGDGFDVNAVINNQSGGVFIAGGSGTLFSRASGRSGVPVFNNLPGAEFRKGSTEGDLLFDTFHFVNNGTLACRGGRLIFNNTRFVHESATSYTGPGSYRLSGGNLVIRGKLGIDATQFVVAAGDVNMHVDGSSLFSAANGGLFRTQGGRFLGTWTLESGTRMNFESGDAGDVDKFFADGSVFFNQGYVFWNGGGTLQAEGNGFTDNPVFRNQAGSRFEFAASGAPFSRASGRSGVPVFINEPGALMITTAPGEVIWNTFNLDQRGDANAGSGGISYSTEMVLPEAAQFSGMAAHRFIGGTLRVRGPVTAAEAPFHIAGGAIIGTAPGSFNSSGAGAWHWLGGSLSGAFTNNGPLFIADPAGAATVKYFADGSVFTNRGTILWTGAGPIQAEGNGFVANPIFNNMEGAFFIDRATGVFNRASGRDGTPRFNNHGLLDVGPGVGNLTMTGWSYAQHPTGTFKLEVSGASNSGFDRLMVGSTASLGGTLEVTKLDGYAPAADTTFAFLTSSSRTGNFASVNAPGFAVDYTAGGATLRALAASGFDDWAASLGLTGEEGLPGADWDKDGVTNFMEYALGMDPKVPSKEGMPEPKTDASHFEISFSRRAPSDLSYYIENPYLNAPGNIVATLLPGASVWTGPATVTETGTGATRTVTVRAPAEIGTLRSDFLRLRVAGPIP